ncbi:MAG TPA: FAD-dependent oxidoreductase [Bryobacteraceae bacterium]|nr:FAD-dependent oxidoreductase [Bryobacteraceae bacterium]
MSPPRNSAHSPRLLIVGGVAAGLSAAARARRVDPGAEITVVEKGPDVSYGACGLPYFVQGQVRSLDELKVYTPAYFAENRNIDVRVCREALEIRTSRREVLLSGGERLPYDKLVIATGAGPDVSAIQGADLPQVFFLHTLQDAARLHAFITNERPKRAVVIGAGYIGLEATEALRAHGIAVEIRNASGDVLGRRDTRLTAVLVQHLARFRVPLRCSMPVREITADCGDLVVVATGVKPNTGLASAAGVALGRTGAIAVNERMETNLPGIYAAGDCAETRHLVTGRDVYIPLGTTANKTGRVAGANAAGRRESFPGVVGTSIVRVCGLGVALTGLSEREAKVELLRPVTACIEAKERAGYFRGRPTSVELVADQRSGVLIGGTVIGEDGVAGRINVIAAAIAQRMTVEDFEALDLAYAPPYGSVWDPLLIAAQQLRKLLH